MQQGWSGNTGGGNSHWYLPVIPVLENTQNFSKNGGGGEYLEMTFYCFFSQIICSFYVI